MKKSKKKRERTTKVRVHSILCFFFLISFLSFVLCVFFLLFETFSLLFKTRVVPTRKNAYIKNGLVIFFVHSHFSFAYFKILFFLSCCRSSKCVFPFLFMFWGIVIWENGRERESLFLQIVHSLINLSKKKETGHAVVLSKL